MRPEVKLIVRFGQIFGTTPFSMQGDQVRFYWLSRQTLYFSLVVLVGLVHLAKVCHLCWSTANESSASDALFYVGYVKMVHLLGASSVEPYISGGLEYTQCSAAITF